MTTIRSPSFSLTTLPKLFYSKESMYQVYTQKDSGFNPFGKWWYRLRNGFTARTATLAILVLVTLSLPVTIFVARNRQTIFQFASGSNMCAGNDRIIRGNDGNRTGYCNGEWLGESGCVQSGYNNHMWTNCSFDGAGGGGGVTCPDQCYSTELWVGIHNVGGTCDDTHPDNVWRCPGGQDTRTCGGQPYYCDGWWRQGTRPVATATPAVQEGNSCNPTAEGCRDVNGMRCWRFTSALPPQSQSVWYPTTQMQCDFSRGDRAYCGAGSSMQTWYCQSDGRYGQTVQTPATPTPSRPICGIVLTRNGSYLNPYLEHVRVGDTVGVTVSIGRTLAAGEQYRIDWGDGQVYNGSNASSTHTYSAAGTFQVEGSITSNGQNYCNTSDTLGNRRQPVIVDAAAGGGGNGTCTSYTCANNPSKTYYCQGVGVNAQCFSTSTCTNLINITTFCAGTTQPPGTTVTQPPATTVTQPPGTTVTQPPGTTVTVPPGTTVTVPPGTVTQPPSGSTQLALTLRLQALGTAAGYQEPPQNPTPSRRSRDVTVEIYSTSTPSTQPLINQLYRDGLTYDSASGKFTGTVTLPSTFTTSANYIVKVRVPGYLKRQLNKNVGVTRINTGTVNTFSEETLVVGDINNDNAINIADYQRWLNCFNQAAVGSCVFVDVTDDGQAFTRTNLSDRAWIVHNMQIQIGD